MIETKFGTICKSAFSKDVHMLIGKFFKILGMSDEENPTLHTYISGLLIELIGRKDLLEFLEKDSRYMSLIYILSYMEDKLSKGELDKKTCKREVFRCIDNIKKLKNRYCKNNVQGEEGVFGG